MNEIPDPIPMVKPKIWNRPGFWLGFAGFFLVNGLVWGLTVALTYVIDALNNQGFASVLFLVLGGLPWLLNIGAPILFAVIKKPGIALGILGGWAVVFIMGLIFGICVGTVCLWYYYKSYG